MQGRQPKKPKRGAFANRVALNYIMSIITTVNWVNTIVASAVFKDQNWILQLQMYS